MAVCSQYQNRSWWTAKWAHIVQLTWKLLCRQQHSDHSWHDLHDSNGHSKELGGQDADLSSGSVVLMTADHRAAVTYQTAAVGEHRALPVSAGAERYAAVCSWS